MRQKQVHLEAGKTGERWHMRPPPFHAPSAVSHLQPLHLQQKRISNLQHRDSNTFHLPTWLAIPLSKPLSSFYTHLIHVGEKGLGEKADILQQTPENHNHRTEIPPGRAGVPWIFIPPHVGTVLKRRRRGVNNKVFKGAVGIDYRDEKGYIPVPPNIFWLYSVFTRTGYHKLEEDVHSQLPISILPKRKCKPLLYQLHRKNKIHCWFSSAHLKDFHWCGTTWVLVKCL